MEADNFNLHCLCDCSPQPRSPLFLEKPTSSSGLLTHEGMVSAPRSGAGGCWGFVPNQLQQLPAGDEAGGQVWDGAMLQKLAQNGKRGSATG